MKLRPFLTKYLEYCEIERNFSPYTIRMYDFYLNGFLSFLQALLKNNEVEINDISSENVRKYRLYLNRKVIGTSVNNSNKSNRNYRTSTQKTFLVALRAFLKYLIVIEKIEVLPPDEIILGKSEGRIPKFLQDDQLKSIFSVQNVNKRSGIRDKAILLLLYSTGLRVSELVSLNVSDKTMAFCDCEGVMSGSGYQTRDENGIRPFNPQLFTTLTNKVVLNAFYDKMKMIDDRTCEPFGYITKK